MFARQQWDESRGAVLSPCGCNWVVHVQTLQDCSTYIVKLSRKSLTMLAAHLLTSCAFAFTAQYRSMMATKILQALHRHYKMPSPGWHHTHTRRRLPPHHQLCDFQKIFNSALDCLLSPLQQQLSQLPPCQPRRIAPSSQESAAKELQTYRRPFRTEVLLWLYAPITANFRNEAKQ
jgi:hypothetical protein